MSAVPIAGAAPIAVRDISKGRSEWTNAWRRFKANKAAIAGAVVILFMCLLGILAPLLAPYNPAFNFPGMRGVGPSWAHPMGFDHISRDMLSRMIFGTRVALIVALTATSVSVVIGVVVGAVSGYFGGWTDSILSRLTDTLMAFPLLALLIVLSALLGPSLVTTIIVIGVTAWARYARLVRADILALKQSDYVVAARAVGVAPWRVILRHMLPNVMGPVIVIATLSVGSVIILESALSFLGLGVQAPTASWGGTLSDGRALIRQYPHISIFPGIMIFITVLAFNLFGDGLRDALDPRQRA